MHESVSQSPTIHPWQRLAISTLPAAATVIFDRYAPGVIGAHPEAFDAIEIHGVQDRSDDSDETACEIDDANPQFYSVYVRLVAGGVDCIGDFSDPSDAARYAEEIGTQYGWPVQSYLQHHAELTE